MITLAETCQRERRAGEQEGRQQALSETLSDYVHLCWDEATRQAFRRRLSTLGMAVWPSLRALHAAYQAGRDPLPLSVSPNGLAPRPKDDAAPATLVHGHADSVR